METIGELIARRRAELGMSQTELAAELCAVANRHTLTRGEVSRWETGEVRPGPFWLRHLATVLEVPIKDLRLARRYARNVSASLDLGLFTTLSTVDTIAELGRADVERRDFVRSATYSLAAVSVPGMDWAGMQERGNLARVGGVRVGMAEVKAVTAMTEFFAKMDDQYGGGHARSAVAAYLADDVAAYLRGSYSDKVGRALYRAAGELVYLLGWMAYDDEQHGLAQRYYIQAVRLATEGGDPLMRSTVLRSMAAQAAWLGHGPQALRLAEAAAEGARGKAHARAQAFYAGMQAEAYAANKEPRRAREAMRIAEAALSRADSQSTPGWTAGYVASSFTYQTGLMLISLGDLAEAEKQLEHSIEIRGKGKNRSQAMVIGQLAEVQLRRGNVEQAASTAGMFLDLFNQIKAERARTALRNLWESLQPYQDVATVRDWMDRAALAAST
ncbi:hypothetical protein LI90_75 [Carbonactinospora thermoautotrophica]|uniref:HTH cro/C1-type domain-containing protein n=1 Tax=Carbonactinospora thermoautotrophica TaxID=1469144 RepID=A0A132ML30_9ACTN|nr:helix-turn-helix transcriptional regulator [Carbonactinospora thermoautotrophica]KWW98455.1 hypothetical protein LI90_75 [Carbonactinospora thermoautotrophica]